MATFKAIKLHDSCTLMHLCVTKYLDEFWDVRVVTSDINLHGKIFHMPQHLKK